MSNFKRARSDQQRIQRRQEILDAARELFQSADFKEIKITDIAQRANISKGSVFLYFGSKEELFIQLTIQEFEVWSDRFLAALPETGIEKEALLDLFKESLMASRTLLRLLAISNTVLEQNISYEQADSYKAFFHERVQLLGKALEDRVVGLQSGSGDKFLLYGFALIAGLYQMANPPAVIQQVLANRNYPLFQIDFDTSFLEILHLFLNGLCR